MSGSYKGALRIDTFKKIVHRILIKKWGQDLCHSRKDYVNLCIYLLDNMSSQVARE